MRDTATAPRGFTLLEVMIIVVIIGVLAVVVLPNWLTSARNKKYDPEISAMFAEISTKEEQYKSEQGNGSYEAATTCPSAPTPNGADWNVACNSTAGWTSLRVNATDSQIRCTYAVTIGCAGCPTAPSTPNPGVGFAAAPTTLAGAWYFVVATCDMDANSSTTNAQFLMTSWDTAQQKLNYGK